MVEAAGRDVRVSTYGMAVAVAVLTGAAAITCALSLGLPLRDPDGFLGPTYVRLPVIGALMLAADVVPRALFRVRSIRDVGPQVLLVLGERWPWRRLIPAMIGLAAFYATYVSYRNLKHYLPLLRPHLFDHQLGQLDEKLAGGVPPAQVLHELLGTGVAAQVLSTVYLAFLIFVPLSLGLALAWRGRARDASWYVTALCLNWALGTASYYVLPSMGPVYAQPWAFAGMPETGTSKLQSSLLESRSLVVTAPDATDRVQSIAAFASLHVSIVLTAALIAQLALSNVLARTTLWIYFGLTLVSTIYFGWHYIADDVAGVGIAVVSVLLAGWGTGRYRRPAAAVDDDAVEEQEEARRRARVPARLRRGAQVSPSSP